MTGRVLLQVRLSCRLDEVQKRANGTYLSILFVSAAELYDPKPVKEVTPRGKKQNGKGAERDQVSSFICSKRLTDGPARASGDESSE